MSTLSTDSPTVNASSPARPRIIFLCGPSRPSPELINETRLLGLAGYIVLASVPLVVSPTPSMRVVLERLSRQKIDMADMVHVVNPQGVINDTMKAEIAYARSTGKPITFLYPTVV